MSPKVNDGPAMRTDKRGKKHKGIVAERLKVLSKTRRCKVLSHVSYHQILSIAESGKKR